MMDTAAALERVRKLLALAGSPDEHEAASAAAMAQAIMDEHAITQAMLGVPDDEPVRVADDPLMGGRRLATWRLRLALALASVNGCALLRASTVGVSTQVEIAGRASDVATVRYLFAYLTRAVDRFAADRAGRGSAWLNAYRAGMVDTISRRLQLAKAELRDRIRATAVDAVATNNAIVRVDARGIDARAAVEASASPGARQYTVKSRGGQDRDGRIAGRADGARVEIDPSVGLPSPSGRIGRGRE